MGDTVAQWLVHWTLGKEVWVWDFQPGHCVVFLGKTINFPSLSCYPRALMGTSKMSGKSWWNAGVWDSMVLNSEFSFQAVIAMLACARLGAIHSVVFGGFAAQELARRIEHAEVCKQIHKFYILVTWETCITVTDLQNKIVWLFFLSHGLWWQRLVVLSHLVWSIINHYWMRPSGCQNSSLQHVLCTKETR